MSFSSLGSAEIQAGKPGKYYRHDIEADGVVLTEWYRCVRTTTVSSKCGLILDIPGSVWQSCGAQGKVQEMYIFRMIFHFYFLLALDKNGNLPRYHNKITENGSRSN